MKKKYRISVIPGDGIGPEIAEEGIRAADASAKRLGFDLDFDYFPIGGSHYLKTGELLEDSVLDSLSGSDAIYLGAIGTPEVKPGILEKEILLKLRFSLDQYINLRPAKLYKGVETPLKDKGPDDIDFVVIRENTEGMYSGAGGFLKRGTEDEVALQESISTRRGTERCVRHAFEFCRKRPPGKRKLTLCGKTNVLTYAFDLWDRVFNEVAGEFPDVETDYMHVDATCMWMVKNPETFDVILTDNMFGDIITDLAAMIQGGMGVAAGANIHPGGVSMFEPIGGSAPKYAGKQMANPVGAVLAAAMMLDELGESRAASLIESAVARALAGDFAGAGAGKMGMSTRGAGDVIVNYINTLE